MSGPLSAFEDWFTPRPPDIQVDLVALAFVNVGGFGVSVDDLLEEDVVAPFLDALDELGQELRPRRQVSCALTLRAAVDFFVMRQRGARSGWQDLRSVNERIREQLAAKGQPTHALDRLLQQLPFREKLWLRAAESWRELCAGPLSDATLDAWLADPAQQADSTVVSGSSLRRTIPNRETQTHPLRQWVATAAYRTRPNQRSRENTSIPRAPRVSATYKCAGDKRSTSRSTVKSASRPLSSSVLPMARVVTGRPW